MVRFVFGLGCLLCAGAALAQLPDSVALSEVTVRASALRYLPAARQQRLDSGLLQLAAHQNLAGLLVRVAPVYIKQQAVGLSTIQFRGTSANHTALLFDDININSATLGHSNLANVPMFLFDEVVLQYGGASAIYGSDAIGGSVQLGAATPFGQGWRIGAQYDVGSFGQHFGGLKLHYSNGHLSWDVRTFARQATNNFEFENSLVYDFEKQHFVHDTQRHAAQASGGVLQQLHYRPTAHSLVGLKIWYDRFWHQVQPDMSANYYGGDYKEIDDQHLRAVLLYRHQRAGQRSESAVSYVHDHQIYNRQQHQPIGSHQVHWRLEHERPLAGRATVRVGAKSAWFLPRVYAYPQQTAEWRADVFASAHVPVGKRLQGAASLRYSWVQQFDAQWSPTLHLRYRVARWGNVFYHVAASGGRSFKTPGLNDRFWQPGGNPHLLAERGYQFELQNELDGQALAGEWRLGLNAYYLQVNNWIQWVNADIWRPKNIKNVHSRGVEASLQWAWQLPTTRLVWQQHYAYNRVAAVESYLANDPDLHRQLFYKPHHIWRSMVQCTAPRWWFVANAAYTGMRYTEAHRPLAAYWLFDTELGARLRWRGVLANLGLGIDNLFDTAYQNQESYAMPGRGYRLSLRWMH